MEKQKVVLISVVGMSPAVLTETIWALHCERPESVPDEVVVYTTLSGMKGIDTIKKKLGKQDSVWNQLRTKIGKPEMTLRSQLFTNGNDEPLDDIVSGEDQAIVADRLLNEIRGLKSAQGDGCRLVASIAGGRKSMSALMYAAMSLGGDAGDIITHVLADADASDCRDFFFPEQSKQKLCTLHGEKAFTAKKVRLELAEIPFVPLGALVGDAVSTAKGSFNTLVRKARQRVQEATGERVWNVLIDGRSDDLKVSINDEPVGWTNEQPKEQYALFCLLMHQHKKGRRGELMHDESLLKGLSASLTSLLTHQKLPISVQQRMKKQYGEGGCKSIGFYANLLDPKAGNGLENSFDRIKSYLKNSLVQSGHAQLAETMLPKRKLRFPDNLHVEWVAQG